MGCLKLLVAEPNNGEGMPTCGSTRVEPDADRFFSCAVRGGVALLLSLF
jgi:hypothetical protein